MIRWRTIRTLFGAACALVFATLAASAADPIRIGFSMALTGGLAPNGKSALLAQKLWEEDVNPKAGCSAVR